MPRVSKFSHFIVFSIFLAALMVFSVGCGSSGSSSSGTRIRFVNASPDQATMNVLIDGVSVATAIANGGGASAYLPVTSGARHIQIQDPATSTNLVDVTPTISSGTSTTFILKDFITTTNTPLILTDDNSAPPTGSFKVRAINLAPTLNGGADLYIEPGTTTTISGLVPTLSGLPFPPTTASSYVSNPAGSWEVVFTPFSDQSQSWGGTAATFAAGQVETSLLIEDVNGIKTVVNLVDVQ